MPLDPETANNVAAAKVGGGSGALALGYAVFDWFKKSGTLKRIKGDIELLKSASQETAVTLARLEERQITKDDLKDMMKDYKGDFQYLNKRIDEMQTQKAGGS